MTTKRLPYLPENSDLPYRHQMTGWGDSPSMSPNATQRAGSSPPPFSRYPTGTRDQFTPPSIQTPRRPSASSSPSTPILLQTPSDEFLGRKKTFWRKLSTPPSASSSTLSSPLSAPRSQPLRTPSSAPPSITPTREPDCSSEHGSRHSSNREIPTPGGLGKKRSSGQLLADFGRGLSRVGSVMKRSPAKSTEEPPMSPQRQTPTRQASKLGLSKQGSIRRQMQQGTWRGKKLADGPEVVKEEDEGDAERDEHWRDVEREPMIADSGDEGIGRPFNVAHDLHITPDLDNLPLEWMVALKAQGMTEAELLTIAAARRRQAGVVNKPLHVRTGSGRRTSQRRKKGTGGVTSPKTVSPIALQHRTNAIAEGNDIVRVQLSDQPGPSPSSSHNSPKHRLPALMHLDDHRASMDMTTAPTAGVGPSRKSSLHPSPTSSAPPSAFSSPKRYASSKRLSDQLRGFASLNLDGVGSWADDVLGQIGDAGSSPSTDKELRIQPPPHSAFFAHSDPSGLPTSPRSPKSPQSPVRRVPVPEVAGLRRVSNDSSAFAQSPTSPRASASHSNGSRRGSEGLRRPNHSVAEPPSPVAQSFTSSVNRKQAPLSNPPEAANLSLSPRSPIKSSANPNTTPPPDQSRPTMSHSHSQSLSTAEDQELRTPSTSENENLRTQLSATSHPAQSEKWRSTEGMGWATSTPEQTGKKTNRKSSRHLELASPISFHQPTIRSVMAPISPGMGLTSPTVPMQPKAVATPSHLPVPLSPGPLDEIDYDLSIPSPLRPPPRPHFSLPASAASDAEDDFYDPLNLPEPGSPILRPSQMELGDRGRCVRDGHYTGSEVDHLDTAGMSAMRQSGLDSRKPSEGSIVMIHPYSKDMKDGEPRSGDRVSDIRLSFSESGLGSRKGSANSDGGIVDKARSGTTSPLPGASPLAVIPNSPDTLSDPVHIVDRSNSKRIHNPLDEDKHPVPEDDHLSPLPISQSPMSTIPSALHYLSRQASARSLRSYPAGRESMADSTFSGESDYRDSVLGAKVMTAQMESLGVRQEVGRMSVFDLGAYISEERVEEDGDEAMGVQEQTGGRKGEMLKW